MLTKQHPYHAAKMLDAIAAGKIVEIKVPGCQWGSWGGNTLHAGCELRIKPDPVRFRLALLKWASGEHTVAVIHEDSDAPPTEACGYFVRWLGDWQEVTP